MPNQYIGRPQTPTESPRYQPIHSKTDPLSAGKKIKADREMHPDLDDTNQRYSEQYDDELLLNSNTEKESEDESDEE